MKLEIKIINRDNYMDPIEILKTVWPILVLQITFQIYALIDLFVIKKKKTKNLSVILWIFIIIAGEIIGPALYFTIGRSEEES